MSETVYKDLGGVTGAIAQHAASVETKIRNELGGNAFDLLPKVFQSLVIVKEEGLPTRRRPLLSDFTPEMTKLIDALVLGRLLHTEGEGKDATVSLSHEKLFDAWPSLRDYVETNKKRINGSNAVGEPRSKMGRYGQAMVQRTGFRLGEEGVSTFRGDFTVVQGVPDCELSGTMDC